MEEKFVFQKIDSPQLLKEVFRLRFQVYCRECHFLEESDYPGGLESDKFDEHAIHFGAFDEAGLLIGAVRLILSSCQKFPIEEHCPELPMDRTEIRRDRSAEISRLTISKLYRRRAKDGLYYEPQVQDKKIESCGSSFMRRIRPMAFGLYRAMYQESKRLGIHHWFALMEKALWLLLKIHGFVFTPLGPEIDFYGPVIPYIANIQDIERSVYVRFPQFFEYFMRNLEPSLQPKF